MPARATSAKQTPTTSESHKRSFMHHLAVNMQVLSVVADAVRCCTFVPVGPLPPHLRENARNVSRYMTVSGLNLGGTWGTFREPRRSTFAGQYTVSSSAST
jgi:hypothetical protein